MAIIPDNSLAAELRRRTAEAKQNKSTVDQLANDALLIIALELEKAADRGHGSLNVEVPCKVPTHAFRVMRRVIELLKDQGLRVHELIGNNLYVEWA